MKLFNLFLYFFFFIISFNTTSKGATSLTTPENLELEQLNKEQKNKLQNVQYQETVAIPIQYKGKLKFSEGREEISFDDFRLYFGIGGRFTVIRDITLSSNLDKNASMQYFNKNNTWEIKDNFNFFASSGLYWRNGIRIEFEYSQMTLETGNYGKSFERYKGTDQAGKEIIFNQYLQTSGVITELPTIIDGTLTTYKTLTNNMIPLAELSVKTYMVNIFFEKSYVKSKIRPYIGFGAGIVKTDINTLVNEGSDTVLGGQVMVGLSYPMANEQLAFYLGYRSLFSMEAEQVFTRITGVAIFTEGNGAEHAFDGATYWNPILVKSRETYKVLTHNLDFGVKFFF